MDRQQKIREKLTNYLKREPTADELINAEKDLNIMTDVLKEEIDAMHTKLEELDIIKNEINVLKLK